MGVYVCSSSLHLQITFQYVLLVIPTPTPSAGAISDTALTIGVPDNLIKACAVSGNGNANAKFTKAELHVYIQSAIY